MRETASLLGGIGRQRQADVYLGGVLGRRPTVPVGVHLLEERARKVMSRSGFAYVAGGAGLESTVAANRQAFEGWRIVPRILHDVAVRDASVQLLSRKLDSPFLLAPIGVLETTHRDADLAVARAAAAEGVPMVFSNQASVAMEECSAVMGDAPRWFQLYWSTSNELVASFVQRAEPRGAPPRLEQLRWRPSTSMPRPLQLELNAGPVRARRRVADAFLVFGRLTRNDPFASIVVFDTSCPRGDELLCGDLVRPPEAAMNLRRIASVLALACLPFLIFAAGGFANSGVGAASITAAPAFSPAELGAYPSDNWLTTGGGLTDNRYSTLTQINKSNVASLKQAWETQFDLTPSIAAATTEEGTALAYNGVLYTPDGRSDVYAIDGATGQHLWTYKPERAGPVLTAIVAVRGIGMGDGRIYEGQGDGSVVALDQVTGGVVWKTPVARSQEGYVFTAAPLYYNGMVILGSSAGDYGARGFAVALDAKTGLELWRWYVQPAPGELGSGTWWKDDWQHGGSIWIYPSADPQLGLVYIVTGNPVPWGGRGPGDNLWTDSIVALHVQNGLLAWGFQTVHHDLWDYDVTNPPVLFDANVGGQLRHGIAVASKTGWVYILDRATGKPLIGIVEKKVPQIKGAGAAWANASPTQPFPIGDAFVNQCSTKKLWPGLAPDGKPYKTGCIFTPFAPTPQGSFLAQTPSAGGGVDWPPSTFNPQLNYIYVCATDGAGFSQGAIPKSQQVLGTNGLPGPPNLYVGVNFGPASKVLPSYGRVVALDVTTNKIVWNDKWLKSCYSGLISTASGLVFGGQNRPGTKPGAGGGFLTAIDAATGQALWNSPNLAGPSPGPPMTYTANGKQYIAFPESNHIYAFTLP